LEQIAYVNGSFVPLSEAKVSILDRGFLFADGIYEVAAVLDGKLIDNASHLARLERSVGEIELALPETTEKTSHGAPTFFVRKRVYCMFANNHHNDGHIAVWAPAEPGLQATLLKTSPEKYFYPPYVGGGGWIGIKLPRVSDDELGEHLTEAWKMIEAKQKKSKPKRSGLMSK
jgi:hypothetical protein